MYCAEYDTLRSKQTEHFPLGNFIIFQWIEIGVESILVADDDELIAGCFQLQQCRNHAWHQLQLLQRIDLLIRRFDDQGAIPVDEQDTPFAAIPAHGCFASHCFNTCSNAARSCLLPTEMRMQSRRAG